MVSIVFWYSLFLLSPIEIELMVLHHISNPLEVEILSGRISRKLLMLWWRPYFWPYHHLFLVTLVRRQALETDEISALLALLRLS